jgi:hypothetical protein
MKRYAAIPRRKDALRAAADDEGLFNDRAFPAQRKRR